ncbi:MAG: hypothetical protein HPY60_10885 [Candidatus Methanofastidiosum sp.]|nr:hypothetical protein [Methanofastidiosum sp.]
MSEEAEGQEILYVDKDNKYLYDEIKFLQGFERKDQFIFAMAFGFINDFKPKLNKKEFITRTSYLKEEDNALLKAVALKSTENIDILSDKKRIYGIAERYANGGIQLLADEVGNKYGSFEKKLEKILMNLYEKISGENSEIEEESKSWLEYILMGETSKIEFKSSMIWDIDENKANKKKMPRIIARSIASFLNTDGGTLLIGVEDNGNIYGIERDLDHVKNKNKDGYQQFLIQTIVNHLGGSRATFTEINFSEKDGKEVCIVDIKPSTDPVFMKCNNKDTFFIRSGNTTRSIEGEELLRYIKNNSNFKDK